jgi:transposase
MEKPYLSNKEYNKLNKQRIKINNKKSIKNNDIKIPEKQYSEDKPIIYNIHNNYHIYNGTHKWLIKE